MITATSFLAKALVGAIRVIAQSSTFQNRIKDHHDDVSTANFDDALKHIYDYETYLNDRAQHALWPCVIVDDIETTWFARGDTTIPRLDAGGGVAVSFYDRARFVGVDDDQRDSKIDFLNFLGVNDDMSGLFGKQVEVVPGSPEMNFHFHGIETLERSTRTIPESRGTPEGNVGSKNDYWHASYVFKYGQER